MHCDQSLHSIVACLHHECSAADQKALEGHLEVCSSCREEFEFSRILMRSLRKRMPVELSAHSRVILSESIQIAAAKMRMTGTGSTSAQSYSFRQLNPPPQQNSLSYEPKRELPAPVQPGQLPVPVSRSRMTAVKLTNGSTLLQRVVVVAILAVFLTGVGMIIASQPARNDVDPKTALQALADLRRAERRIAYGDPQRRKEVILQKPELTDLSDTQQPEKMWVFPHLERRTGEVCLMAYTDRQIADFKVQKNADVLSIEKWQAQSKEVIPEANLYRMPEEWMKMYTAPLNNRVVALHLADRTEIWSVARLEAHLRDDRAMALNNTQGAPEVSGLPPKATVKK